jgi:diaminopimelate epimerase
MKVINADGSQPEMCGNGLRCLALFLVEQGLVPSHQGRSEFVVQTDAGPHPVSVDTSVQPAQVRVHMRPASLLAREVLRDGQGEWLERAFDDTGPKLTMVSMGNPHAVTFDHVADLPGTGPRLEKDARFRAGANIGFARLASPTKLDLTVWERGVGFTLACGTGACAAAVAAVETGRSPRGEELVVTLPGGPLRIRVGERGQPIEMTGPARHVFAGQLALDGFEARA